MRWLVAVLLAVPIGLILWLELLYLVFGLTGREMAPAVNVAFLVLAFGAAVAWPLYKTRRSAEVGRRSCRLGVAVAMLLPVVAAVPLVWDGAFRDRDLGMGGLAIYGLALVAAGAGLVFIVLFALGSHWCSQRLRGGIDR